MIVFFFFPLSVQKKALLNPQLHLGADTQPTLTQLERNTQYTNNTQTTLTQHPEALTASYFIYKSLSLESESESCV